MVTLNSFDVLRLENRIFMSQGFSILRIAKSPLYCFFIACCIQGCGKSSTELTTADLIEQTEPAVLVIDVTTPAGTGLGSAFVVKNDGIAVTNYHVIEGSTSATARFSNGKTLVVQGVLFFDIERDIAIIKLADVKKSLPILKLAKELPRKGDATIAFGSPKGLSFSASEGIVSAIRNDNDTHQPGWPAGILIQTTAPISAGNSGGPLLNKRGEVVGMNTFVFVSGQNLNFAVSAQEVMGALDKVDVNTIVELPLQLRSTFTKHNQQSQSEPTFSDGQKRFLDLLASMTAEREEKTRELRAKIDASRLQVKTQTILANDAGERAALKSLRSEISALNELISKPLDFPVINLSRMKSGEIGVLGASFVEIVQVLSKSDGRCLAHVSRVLVKLRGLDLTNVTDSERLRIGSDLIFEVVGTTTYETVQGGTNTVFELACISNAEKFRENRGTTDPTSDLGLLPLTDEENERRRVAIEHRNREQALAKESEERAAEDARLKRISEEEAAKVRKMVEKEKNDAAAKEAELRNNETKAAAKLILAKQFLDKNEYASAKKWLKNVVKDFPNTEAATEAEQLLKGLP